MGNCVHSDQILYQRSAVWAGMAFNFAAYVSGIVAAIYYETPRAGETSLAVLDGRTLIPLGY